MRRAVVTSAAVLLALIAVGGRARAQFRVDRYTAPPQPGDLLWLERAATPARSPWPFARLSLELADDPLVIVTEGTDRERFQVVDEQLGIHLSAGARLYDRVDVALLLPVFVQASEAAQLGAGETVAALDSAAVGDPALDLRVVLLDHRAPVELALAATLRVPLGDEQALAADDTVSFSSRLLVSKRFWRNDSWAGASLGLSIRPDRTFGDLDVGTELTWALGGLVNFHPRVGATLELAGSSVLGEGFSEFTTPIEGTIGGRYNHPLGLVASAGIGTGLTSGYGNPDVRGIVTFGYQAPVPAPPPPAPTPPPLDPDRDHDGILDPQDQCPLEAEDRDGFEDDNGCPDPDNDQDGVLDPADQCPMDPEDRDEFEDDDGCPDPDNDQDGILDPQDQCPMEPETRNGVDDQDGCPDFVRIENGQIRTLEPVLFRTNSARILARSHPMLLEIASLIRARADLGRVSIEGHTDSRGSARRNLRLSDRRAASVMTFLTEAGVAAERLAAHGFGEEHPIDSNRTAPGRQRNRRVEFILIDRGGVSSVQTPAPATP